METLRFERDERGVATLTFDRPEKKNAISPAMWAELVDVLDTVEDDRDTRVLVLTGAGDAFTSGASICEPGDNARGAWWDMMTGIPEITHRSASKI